MTVNSNHCVCSDEAEILYRMYRTLGTLADAEWTGESMCCNDEEVHIIIKGHDITVKDMSGNVISHYTHPEDSTDTFEQSTEATDSPFQRQPDNTIPVTKF